MLMLSAGVYTREVDFSTNVSASSTCSLGLVGVFSKGELWTKTLVTSGPDLVRKFGTPLLTSYSGLAALEYLRNGNMLWVVRISSKTGEEDNAVAATASLLDNKTTPAAGITISAKSPGTWANERLSVVVNNADEDAGTFDLFVYYDSVLVEAHYDCILDATNTTNYIEDKLANSNYVSAVDENEGEWEGIFISEGSYTLDGGADGDTNITEAEVIAGLNEFANADDVDIRILCAPGYSEPAVIGKGITICEDRGDCMFLVDPPFGLTEQEVVEWHNGAGEWEGEHQAFNSSYAALYWPWVYLYDEYNGAYRWVPPSGLVAGSYAYNDYVAEPWYAPAGFIRGRLTTPIKVEKSANKGSRDFMYSGGNAVNPMVNFAQEGITIWGQRTLQRRSSATDRVNVRRLLLVIRKAIAVSSMYVVFEQNDYHTWERWVDMVKPYLDGIKAARGLYDLAVIMDETTVTPEHIDRNEMPGKILLKVTKTSEAIPIDFVLYKTGASFEA